LAASASVSLAFSACAAASCSAIVISFLVSPGLPTRCCGIDLQMP
jgi:hypothetical protein